MSKTTAGEAEVLRLRQGIETQLRTGSRRDQARERSVPLDNRGADRC